MDYVKVLSDLISIDTTVPPGRNYEKAVSYLEPLFKRVGFETQKVAIPREHADGNEGRVNLIAHRRMAKKPRLIFYSHIDVVPAEGWDAFAPKVENGRIFGRGSADMKGSIAALLLALDSVKKKPIKYDTSVMVTTDEEVGQGSQIRYLGKFLEPVRGANFFDLDSSFGYAGVASLGAIHMDIKVKGKSVHSGLAHLGENAVEGAIRLASALLELKKDVVKRHSRVLANPETGLKNMEAKLNINVIKGGLKVNIVPDECVISIDRRLIPEEKIDAAEKELMDTTKSVKGVNWELQRLFKIPTTPPFEGAIADELSKIIKEVTGKSGKYGEQGSGDFGPVVSQEWKAKSFGLGVIRPDCNIHGKNEFVHMKDIEALAKIITKFISG